MSRTRSFLAAVYYDPRLAALLPVLAVIFDYTLTLMLSRGQEEILAYEASPLVRFAVEQNLMPIYTLVLMGFYYLASYTVLRLLSGSGLYGYGVGLVGLVSLTHLLGGLSWYVRDGFYSDTVIGLSLVTVVVAIALFGYASIREFHNAASE
jgi:hypothetical protein